MKPRIYLFIGPDVFDAPRGCALAEDGTLLWDFLYETPEVAIKAMGGNLRQYIKHYAAGFELVIPSAGDLGFQEAQRLNRAAWEAGAEQRAAENKRQMEAKRFARVPEPEGEDQDTAFLLADPWPGD